MSTLGLMILIALAANVVLGVLVLIAHPRRNVNQSYLLLAALVALWKYHVWRIYGADTADTAAWGIRMASMSTALFPIGAHLLRQAILHPDEPLPRLLRRIRLLAWTGLIMAVLCASPYLLLHVEMPTPGAPFWHVPEPRYSFINYLFMAYFLIAVSSLIWCFIRDLRTVRGIARVEIGFILLGVAAALFVGSFGSMLVPLATGSSASVPLSNSVSILLLTSIVSYGLATRRIMDMAAMIRRTVAYALLVVFLSALYLAVFISAQWLTGRVMVGASYLPHLAAMLSVAFVMLPAQGRMNQVARRLFIDAHTVDIAAVTREATVLCESVNRLDDLLRLFGSLVTRAWSFEHLTILLRDEHGAFLTAYCTGTASADLRLRDGDPALTLLMSRAEPLQIDALRRGRPRPDEREAAAQLDAMRADALIGIFRQQHPTGVLILGPREDGRLFDRMAQDALAQLGHQLAVAIENARLYTQVQDAKIYHEVLVDSMVNGVIAVNETGRITVCNREAQRLLSIKDRSLKDRPMSELPEAMRKPLHTALRVEAVIRDVEITLRRPVEGDPVPLRLSSSYIRGHEGGVVGALLVFQDLTALRKLEAQLRRSDRLASVGTLAAGMAHEIKNPLVTIKTFTQLLPEQYADPAFRDRFAPLVHKEVNRIDALVTGLLEFARPICPEMAPVRIHAILDHTLNLCEQALRQGGIRLEKHAKVRDDLVQGDFNLLVQVFLNLSLNAIEAMREGDTLRVTTANRIISGAGRPARPAVEVRIEDTGRGIRAEDVPRIFDPFFTTREDGTGLGLAIAHGIIQQHEAMIDVESAVGIGTTFILTFPRSPEAGS